MYQPLPKTFAEYKEYYNTRAIDPKRLHLGCIKGEIAYFYRPGAKIEEYEITIQKDARNRLQVVVVADIPDREHQRATRKLYHNIMDCINNEVQRIYEEARKVKQPPLLVRKVD